MHGDASAGNQAHNKPAWARRLLSQASSALAGAEAASFSAGCIHSSCTDLMRVCVCVSMWLDGAAAEGEISGRVSQGSEHVGFVKRAKNFGEKTGPEIKRLRLFLLAFHRKLGYRKSTKCIRREI